MMTFIKNLIGKPEDDLKKAYDEGAVILDVRTASEFQEGHIKGSKNISLNEILSRIDMISSWNKPVITVCRSGARSASAKNILETKGIQAYNGGAWTNFNKMIKI